MIYSIKKLIKKNCFIIMEKFSSFFDKSRPLDRERIKKILVFEGGGIGDLLRIFPVLEILNDNFPSASLSIVVTPGAADLLQLLPRENIVKETFYYDIRGKHKSFFKKLSLLLLLKKKRYDLVFSSSRGEGMREREIMSFIIGAPYRIGFSKNNIGKLQTTKIEFSYSIPILQQNLRLLEKCGLRITKDEIDMQINERDEIFAKDMIGNHGMPIISIHPDAAWKVRYRVWPLNNYIELIKEIAGNYKGRIIILGDKTTKEYVNSVVKKEGVPEILNLCGATTLSQTAAIIKQSALFIGNDSSLLHIANALHIPSIGIFGPTSPEQVLSSLQDCLVIKKNIDCSPCYVHQYDFSDECGEPECLNEIRVSDVMEAVDRIFENTN